MTVPRSPQGINCTCQNALETYVALLLASTVITNCLRSCYRPQTKFAKVMFLHLSVSHSVHRRGEYLGRYSPWQVHPPEQVPPWQVHPLAGTLPGRVYPPGLVHSPWACTPPGNACWDTVNKRAVRILLECILVSLCIFMLMTSETSDPVRVGRTNCHILSSTDFVESP